MWGIARIARAITAITATECGNSNNNSTFWPVIAHFRDPLHGIPASHTTTHVLRSAAAARRRGGPNDRFRATGVRAGTVTGSIVGPYTPPSGGAAVTTERSSYQHVVTGKGAYCKKKWLLRPVKLADPRKRHAFWCRMRERRPRLSLTPPRWCVGTRPSRDMRTSRVALDTGVTHDSPTSSRCRHQVGEHSIDLG